jgi:hypothetical protein
MGCPSKIAAKVAAPVIGQVVGGLLGGTQTGQGIQTGHGYGDFLFNAAKGIAQTFSGHKIPISSKGGKLVLDTKAQSGRDRKKRVKRQQKGKGFITDLLKTGAKQALRAAAQTGLDVLDNKRPLKDAIKTHGIRAIKSTAQPLLARGGPRGGPKKTPIKRASTKKPPSTRASRPRASRPLPKVPMNLKPQNRSIKRPVIKRPKRVLDIFD